jgi:coenzyme PQQ precursor peptide PqqA
MHHICFVGNDVLRDSAGKALSKHKRHVEHKQEETDMKEAWTKPQVTEQEVGLEVTSYLPADLETR